MHVGQRYNLRHELLMLENSFSIPEFPGINLDFVTAAILGSASINLDTKIYGMMPGVCIVSAVKVIQHIINLGSMLITD
eukprot:11105912-Karenia_brevis.AAC.1